LIVLISFSSLFYLAQISEVNEDRLLGNVYMSIIYMLNFVLVFLTLLVYSIDNQKLKILNKPLVKT